MISNARSQTRKLGRFRRVEALRAIFRETRLAPADFVQPIFVAENPRNAGPIASLPGVSRYALRELPAHARAISESGVRGVLLFGLPDAKDEHGSEAFASHGIVPRAVESIKEHAPALAVITDVCLCQYTSHGHCAVLDGRGISRDATLETLGRAAVVHAAAGADVVAPSGMMDGGVAAIREALDDAGFAETGILSYAAKFASALYGPFRDAAQSAPARGDRRGHQIDPANGVEAIAEARQDIAEGADAVIVKPAGPSLDVIARLRDAAPGFPIVGYQVSGEHAMIAAAAAQGWIDERAAILESLVAIKRAGASAIITYSAARAARWITESGGNQP